MAAPPPKNKGIAAVVQPFVCGGAAAMFASSCVSPMDVAKTNIQVLAQGGGQRPGLLKTLKLIVGRDGFKGLYAGLSASLMRQAVYGTARLGLHRVFSEKMKEAQGGGALAPWKSVVSSMASGAIASVIGNPFDISMVRMQADGLRPPAERRGYKNVFDAIARISREEGVLRLWRGFEPTVCRAIAMNVGMMATYDQAKAAIVKLNGDNFGTQLMSSAISGLACVITSLPFDLIKTRLQNMKPAPTGEMPYRGVMHCAQTILKVEGPLAFWTGFVAYYGRTAPHAMIILMTLEQFNILYKATFNT